MTTFGNSSGNRGWSVELGSARDDEFGSRRTVGSREALGQAWKKAQRQKSLLRQADLGFCTPV